MPEAISRRNLPHWFVPDAWHFVTYRLDGTIPGATMARYRETRDQKLRNIDSVSEQVREAIHKQFFADYDRYLDANREIQWLANPKVAAMIRQNLYHHHGTKYHLLSYCVMPNHVHVLLRPIDSMSSGNSIGDEVSDTTGPLTEIMHSLKSYTANQANKILGRTGQFWQHESFDHWVRDEDELQRIVEYIAWNPVKARLASKPHEWWFSSAHDRFLQDGEEEGFLLLR